MSVLPDHNPCRGPFIAAALAAVLVFGGCAEASMFSNPVHAGPFYKPRNFAGDKVLPAAIRRVVLLPVFVGAASTAESAAMLDQVMLVALQKQSRFEVVALSREDSRRWFGAAEFSSVSALPHDYIAKITAKFAADAVIFMDLTVYKPYRPLAVGLRAKLAIPANVRIIWTFDEIISAEDPGVTNSARRQFLEMDRSGQPLDLSPAVLQSPTRFATFAAESMFQTLPPR